MACVEAGELAVCKTSMPASSFVLIATIVASRKTNRAYSMINRRG
jgi:hypothetical protein